MIRLGVASFVLLSINLYACVCATDITTSFSNSSSEVSNLINMTTSEISNNLIPQVVKNIEDIKKQNAELEKLVLSYTEEVLKQEEILFLLKKIENSNK
ncbi:hypothetical protein CFT12S00416_07805 [Campylobacter fetus subsp. testudinum]|uniref:hypothetical protein n=2 Tax=Campylobacter fetus TaxID=196 RepID=UPI000818C4FD|nr:hypothetical protein [Campylobacter fetus]OCR87723.1 hypothetical protein CFT12S00416_07805 [Campylobacter fetus subsp. testudinum]